MIWFWLAVGVLVLVALDALRRMGEELHNTQRDLRFAELLRDDTP